MAKYVVNSNTRASINTADDTIVLISQAIMPLKANDTLNTVMSVSATGQGCGLINIALLVRQIFLLSYSPL